MYVVYGLYVVTSGIRSDVLSLLVGLKHSSCVSATTLYISFRTSFLLYPHATKYSEYCSIRFFKVSSEEHMRLSLSA